MRKPILIAALLLTALRLPAQQTAELATRIGGDFNGDGQRDSCWLQGGRLSASFKGSKPPGPWSTEVLLLNEGDLDGDGGDELSAIIAPEHGCTYGIRTYSFKGGSWRTLVPYFLWPRFCEPFGAEDAQRQVFRESGHIYRLDWDANEEDQAKAWKRVQVR